MNYVCQTTRQIQQKISKTGLCVCSVSGKNKKQKDISSRGSVCVVSVWK